MVVRDLAIAGFTRHWLDERCSFFEGRLPEELMPTAAGFEAIWALHPKDYHVIKIYGRLVETPRWQQAYGADYHYTGQLNAALPVARELEPFYEWSRAVVDERLNGMLLNWYDGAKGHYMGPHHDSGKNLLREAPIVTISLGEARVFRLSDPKWKLKRDFVASAGTVFVMPPETNLAWKHGVPWFSRYQGRRISVTLRGFSSVRVGGS